MSRWEGEDRIVPHYGLARVSRLHNENAPFNLPFMNQMFLSVALSALSARKFFNSWQLSAAKRSMQEIKAIQGWKCFPGEESLPIWCSLVKSHLTEKAQEWQRRQSGWNSLGSTRTPRPGFKPNAAKGADWTEWQLLQYLGIRVFIFSCLLFWAVCTVHAIGVFCSGQSQQPLSADSSLCQVFLSKLNPKQAMF